MSIRLLPRLRLNAAAGPPRLSARLNVRLRLALVFFAGAGLVLALSTLVPQSLDAVLGALAGALIGGGLVQLVHGLSQLRKERRERRHFERQVSGLSDAALALALKLDAAGGWLETGALSKEERQAAWALATAGLCYLTVGDDDSQLMDTRDLARRLPDLKQELARRQALEQARLEAPAEPLGPRSRASGLAG